MHADRVEIEQELKKNSNENKMKRKHCYWKMRIALKFVKAACCENFWENFQFAKVFSGFLLNLMLFLNLKFQTKVLYKSVL